MPEAWSGKRERQYKHIKAKLKSSGKSDDRAEEEAARTVNKTRADKGETKTTKKKAARSRRSS